MNAMKGKSIVAPHDLEGEVEALRLDDGGGRET